MSARSVTIGTLGIGGSFPVRVESMLRTPLGRTGECLEEILHLHENGCELARVAFPEVLLSDSLSSLLRESPMEIMADIHFDHRLAMKAIEVGCRSIRINPGNMASKSGLAELCKMIIESGTVVRVGANGGSLSRAQIAKAGDNRVSALLAAVDDQIRALEDHGVEKIIMSLKSSSVNETLKANTLLAERFGYPVHAGLTEAGPGERGIIKSSVALGSLLGSGIGDTIRISLTGPAIEEVRVAKRIIQSLGLRRFEPDLISCPACGRRRASVPELVDLIEPLLDMLEPHLTVAVMGCEVNGPQEASGADIGIAGTPSGLMLFVKGKPLGACSPDNLESRFLEVCRKQGFLRPER
jgi:(E)-4-hydroxy-3-methylbut-2-enyl-diphosphate synthase